MLLLRLEARGPIRLLLMLPPKLRLVLVLAPPGLLLVRVLVQMLLQPLECEQQDLPNRQNLFWGARGPSCQLPLQRLKLLLMMQSCANMVTDARSHIPGDHPPHVVTTYEARGPMVTNYERSDRSCLTNRLRSTVVEARCSAAG